MSRDYIPDPWEDAAFSLRAIREVVEAEAPQIRAALLLIAECLVSVAFAASPDGGRRQARLEALRADVAERET